MRTYGTGWVVALALAGCEGEVAPSALIALTDAGEACPAGGVLVQTGLDEDGDGTLDAAEVEASEAICDGVGATGPAGATGPTGEDGAPALVSVSEEPAGVNCATGGTRIDAGVDADADGALDPNEVTSTSYLCDDAPVALRIEAEPAGVNCPNGGTEIASGTDDNANGTLDVGEEDEVLYVCGGDDALLRVTEEAPGPNCADGGVQVDAGLDTNADGNLQTSEITSTAYLCADASSFTTTTTTTGAAIQAYAAFFGAQFGVDAAGNVAGFTDSVYGTASDPSAVIILVDATYTSQCAVVVSNPSAVNSAWDPSALLGWEMPAATNTLSFSDCDGWEVFGGNDAATLFLALDYQFGLGRIDPSVASFIDSYPGYYYDSTTAVGLSFNLPGLTYYPTAMSAVGYDADATLATDFSVLLSPAQIFVGGAVASGVYVNNNYLGLLAY